MNLTLKKRLIITYSAVLLITLLGLVARLYWMTGWTTHQHVMVTFFSFILITCVFEAHILLNYILNKFYPFERNIFTRIVIQVAISIAIMKFIHFLIFPTVSEYIASGGLAKFLHVEDDFFFFAFTTVLVVSLSIFINSLLISFYFFKQWKESLVKAEKLEKEKALVQFEGLKNQLNPHFLFNAFSSLNSLINEDKELASKFLKNLSKVYRYILQTNEQETISLQTEMDFIQNYIFLLNTRFAGMINIQQKVEESAYDKKIVPVTTQNLLENAIKHNIISAEKPLHINIFTTGNYLVIENNLQKKGQVETSNREGLSKMKSLYSYLSTEPFEVEETENLFRVKIPLIG